MPLPFAEPNQVIPSDEYAIVLIEYPTVTAIDPVHATPYPVASTLYTNGDRVQVSPSVEYPAA